MMKIKLCQLFNLLYKHCYPLYKPLYFVYKYIDDYQKIILIKKFIQPGMVALDIGANIGFYTILLSKLVGPTGYVYAFEPEATNFRRLKENTKKLKNVSTVQAAVGEKTEKIKLYPSNSLNVDHRTYPSADNRHYYKVNCLAIDDYIKPNIKINFIKTDIQGYDYHALLGMRKTIKNSPQLLIIGECWPWGLKKAGAEPSALFQYLKQLNISYSFFDKNIKNENLIKVEKNENIYFDFYGFKKSQKHS